MRTSFDENLSDAYIICESLAKWFRARTSNIVRDNAGFDLGLEY